MMSKNQENWDNSFPDLKDSSPEKDSQRSASKTEPLLDSKIIPHTDQKPNRASPNIFHTPNAKRIAYIDSTCTPKSNEKDKTPFLMISVGLNFGNMYDNEVYSAPKYLKSRSTHMNSASKDYKDKFESLMSKKFAFGK